MGSDNTCQSCHQPFFHFCADVIVLLELLKKRGGQSFTYCLSFFLLLLLLGKLSERKGGEKRFIEGNLMCHLFVSTLVIGFLNQNGYPFPFISLSSLKWRIQDILSIYWLLNDSIHIIRWPGVYSFSYYNCNCDVSWTSVTRREESTIRGHPKTSGFYE